MFTWMITIPGGPIFGSSGDTEYDPRVPERGRDPCPCPPFPLPRLLAMGGLLFWIAYLLLDEERLAWAAVAILGTVAVLGLIMAARWIRVYRSFAAPGPSLTRSTNVPPERNFPLPVVVAHGILAVTTLVLVLFTALGAGGS